jgi:hypothetical protein
MFAFVYFPSNNMARFSDSEIEQLIDFWREEEVLWNVSSQYYLNADCHKAALSRISQKMGGRDIGKYCDPVR